MDKRILNYHSDDFHMRALIPYNTFFADFLPACLGTVA